MKRKISCSFCGKVRANDERVFASSSMEDNPNFLCEPCVKKCYAANEKNQKQSVNIRDDIKIMKPSAIAESLKEYIVGQDDAIKSLSVIFANHSKRVKFQDLQINQKFHTLLIGPSGCGKTMMVTKMAELFNIPSITVDATTLTAAGYAGEDVDNCIYRLYEIAGRNVSKAECGIVFVDEFDKCKKQLNFGRDVRGEEVQFAFLKLLDGKDVYIENKKNPFLNEVAVKINTSNILFIFGGFFDGMNEVSANTSILNVVNQSYGNLFQITPDLLIDYGIVPEIVGRINNYVACNRLDVDDLFNILKNNKTSVISEYKNLLLVDGINIDFTDDAIMAIAQLSNKTCGARDLRNLVGLVLRDILYNGSDNEKECILIDKQYVLEKLNQDNRKFCAKIVDERT